MTRIIRRKGVTFLIPQAEAHQQCDDCGKVAELRPYGPGGSMICFACMKKDEEGAKTRLTAILDSLSSGRKEGARCRNAQ